MTGSWQKQLAASHLVRVRRLMSRIETNIIFGVCLMILSVVVFALSFQFPEQTLAFSPKIFPRFVSICLFLISAILFVQGIRADKKTKPDVNKAFLKILATGILISFAYTQLLPVIGYVASTPFFIAGIMLLFKEKSWVKIAATSVITSVILYILFRIVFKVPLPRFDLF